VRYLVYRNGRRVRVYPRVWGYDEKVAGWIDMAGVIPHL
jgi:hypothetical protein